MEKREMLKSVEQNQESEQNSQRGNQKGDFLLIVGWLGVQIKKEFRSFARGIVQFSGGAQYNFNVISDSEIEIWFSA